MIARVPSRMLMIALSPTAARSLAQRLADCLSAPKPALETVAAGDTQNAQICTKITVSLNKPRYVQNGGSARVIHEQANLQKLTLGAHAA
jgi:hypothetical protein